MTAKGVPTSWTKPLQLAVIVYAAISGIYGLTIPLWMTSVGRGAAFSASLIGFVISLIAIVGAANRWTWLYEAVWVLLGLGVLVLLFDVVRGSYSLTYGILLPTWAGWLRLLQTAIGGALALAMLYARNTRGPWAMTRQPLTRRGSTKPIR